MSTIKSSNEHLTLNADGSSKDIKFQANGVQKASLSSTGVFTATSFAGSGSALTGVGVAGISSSADATAMTIDSSERIGIGRTSAGPFFDVYNTGNYTGLRVETTVGAEVTCQLKGGGTSGSANVLDIRNGSNGNLFEVRQDGRGLSQFTAKAWIRVNQTGTQSISDSHNISSISDGGVGKTTAFFANSMANTNYAVTFGADFLSWGSIVFSDNFATGSFLLAASNGSAYEDQRFVHGVVYGD